ncbi:MAG: hypothetical protein KDK55_02910 [Chlamydiia bacterium]|nr:hypothetical protein [Chlamydiia bacterium]
MHRNAIWIAFILILCSLSTWFGINAYFALHQYFQLKESAPATIIAWKTKNVKNNRTLLLATFNFVYREHIITGESPVAPSFPNPWAAEKAQSYLAKKKWTAFFHPHHLDQATLQKKFPTKLSVSALVMIGLLIYFISLGRYLYTNARG